MKQTPQKRNFEAIVNAILYGEREDCKKLVEMVKEIIARKEPYPMFYIRKVVKENFPKFSLSCDYTWNYHQVNRVSRLLYSALLESENTLT